MPASRVRAAAGDIRRRLEAVLEVNLTGPFLCTKAAAPLMREHGGGAIVK